MTFKSAYIKLTILYVSILMLLSIFFSFGIYQISTQELDRGFRKQTTFFSNLPDFKAPPEFSELDKLRAQQLAESNKNLKNNLIYFNLAILIVSTFISYFFAKRTLKPIENNMEAQNHFTADASHELRTPLTAMRTEIEVNLNDKNFNLANAKTLLKSNLEEINKLESLSNALLKLARYQEENKTKLKKLQIDEIIVEAYEKLEKLASQKQITFTNQLQAITIKGDKQSLIELFIILLDNAIKYSPNKSEIMIKVLETKKYAQISIADRGIGIKASHLPYIFNRFYRADSSRNKEKVDGYGLGLAIAKKIVEFHKGNITAKSRIGKGSEFIVNFPKL